MTTESTTQGLGTIQSAPKGATLRLQVRAVNDGKTQLSWIDEGDGDFTYRVSGDQLVAAANTVRARLQSYLKSYIGSPYSGATTAELTRLVQAGQDFFRSLFLSNESAVTGAQELYRTLDAAGPLKLLIKVDPPLSLPWPLLVPPEVGVPENGFTPETLGRVFFALRHDLSLSTFCAGSARPERIGIQQYRALAVMHREIYDAAKASLESPVEHGWLDAFAERCVRSGGVVFDSSRFVSAITDASNQREVRLRFAYLLGHANGATFRFAGNDDLNASTLAARLGNTPGGAHQHTILFLNGCETATESERFSFGELVGHFTVTGLIGTEVRVPDRFAFRFALAFLHLVLSEGWTLRAALEKLRREHLPISLAYSLYAADGLSIEASAIDAGTSAAPPHMDNYSRGRVACKP